MSLFTIDARRLSTGSTPNFGLRLEKYPSIQILQDNGIDWTKIKTSIGFEALLSCGDEIVYTRILFSNFAKGKSLKGEISMGRLPEWREWVKTMHSYDDNNHLDVDVEWDDGVLFIDIVDERFKVLLHTYRKYNPKPIISLAA